MNQEMQSEAGLTLTDQVLEAAAASARSAGREARAMVASCLLDWTACAIVGAREPLVDILAADALEFGRAGDWPLIGRDERVGLREAVLVNGAAGHALDYDDGLAPMVGHPSVAIAPALLCLAAQLGTTGPELVTAYLVAVEFGSRVGRLLAPGHYQRGFHGTATAGALGAAAGCAYLLGLEGEKRAHAIGLAATRAAGLKASFGTMAKPLHPGWAATVGLTAAQWAQRGYTGAADILGHPTGLRTLSDDFNPADALADAAPYILQVRFKRHAACAGTHPTIEAMRSLRQEHGLSADRITNATIRVPRQLDSVCNQQVADTGLKAKFSLRMVSAMALAGIDTAAPESFSDIVVADPALRRLFEQMQIELQDEPNLTLSRVTVDLEDGSSLEGLCDLSLTTAAAEMVAVPPKFAALVAPVLGEDGAGALEAAITGLDAGGRPRQVLELAALSAH